MSVNYRRQKGTRQFGEQPGRQANERWDKDLVTLDEPKVGDHCTIRPVGGVMTVGAHYVRFRSPKDGKMKGFFMLCPNWDLAEQDEKDRNCPVCRHFHPRLNLKSDKFDYLKMPMKYRYVFHAFNVTNIKERSKPIFGVVQTHRLGMEQIDKVAKIKGYGPDHPDKGYTLHWLVEPAKQKRFNTETTFQGGDSMPVKWDEEKGLWLIKVGKKVYKGKEQELLDLIPKPPSSAEISKKLADLGLFDALNGAVKGGVSSSGSAAPSDDDEWNEDNTDAGDDWEDPEAVDETVDDEDESAEDESAEDENWDGEGEESADDDEWEDEEDSDDEDVDDEDVDDEDVDDEDVDDEDVDDEDEDEDDVDDDDDGEWDDEEEEEPEPEPKKKAKKSGKAKKGGGSKSKSKSKSKPKGKAKKKAAEVDDDDEWDDDLD